ncbi:carbonic anhydrase [Pelomonas sp. KK5]|uniref:carbonic anhydrase n=1 Tax=Pelomonas sp. KK5 TaxID=1855730 RepID=UPI0009F897A3|nr:carbonic anhydrase family protein [Pelomonas sp. KK5]
MRLPLLALAAFAVLTPSLSGAADESQPLDVLRQRLSEKLVKEPAGQVKLVGKGGKDAPAPKPKAPPHRDPPPWSYAGEGGPEHWASLSPANGLCAAGQRQSPIDIKDTIKVDLEKIRFDYQAGAFSVVNTGRTVQVSPAPGSAIEVMGRRFELQQIHFHHPAEERLNGRQFDMSAHLVHKDAEGRLAVVAVLLDRDLDNKSQPVVQQIWNGLPLELNDPLASPGPLDPQKLLPEDRSYFTYMGSLETPPCSENVLWIVMRQPVLVSKQQIEIFSRLYPMNARPVQPIAGRMIKESL